MKWNYLSPCAKALNPKARFSGPYTPQDSDRLGLFGPFCFGILGEFQTLSSEEEEGGVGGGGGSERFLLPLLLF